MIKTQKFWIEIVLVGTATAGALALFIATLGVAADAVAADTVSSSHLSQQQVIPNRANESPAQAEKAYEGMISCSRCGAKHPATSGAAASTCVRTCVHGGESFTLIDADAVYVLEGDSNLLTKFAGQRAHVVGTLKGKILRVSSAETA